MVPVLHDLQGKDLHAIAAQRRALVEAARAGRLEASAFAAASFSISNVGTTGADRFRAIIYPGQTAILAVGRIHERVVPHSGQVSILRGCYLNLSVDHRMVDGIDASRFIGALADRLEHGPWRPMPEVEPPAGSNG